MAKRVKESACGQRVCVMEWNRREGGVALFLVLIELESCTHEHFRLSHTHLNLFKEGNSSSVTWGKMWPASVFRLPSFCCLYIWVIIYIEHSVACCLCSLSEVFWAPCECAVKRQSIIKRLWFSTYCCTYSAHHVFFFKTLWIINRRSRRFNGNIRNLSLSLHLKDTFHSFDFCPVI